VATHVDENTQTCLIDSLQMAARASTIAPKWNPRQCGAIGTDWNGQIPGSVYVGQPPSAALRVCDFFEVAKNRCCKQSGYDDQIVENL